MQHQRQDDAFVARIRRQVECRRRRIVARYRERRAVGQHTLRRVDAQLAKRQGRVVDRNSGEAPGVADRRGKALPQLILGVAIMLLEVLGLEEHPLGPDHLVVPGHSD